MTSALPLFDAALERTLVMAVVVAPALLDELPETFDGDALADYRATAVWIALCNLFERDAPITLWSVRDELERRGYDPTWFERPTPTWPRAMTDIAMLIAERLVHDPGCLPIAAWAWSLMRLAHRRREAIASWRARGDVVQIGGFVLSARLDEPCLLRAA